MNEQAEEALPENIEVATPGQLLHEAREAAQYSVDDIAGKLNLKASLIMAIEENNFDEIGSVIFARGYLKSYAKLLHLDETEILTAFEYYTTAEQQHLEMQSFSNRKGKKAVDKWITVVTTIFIVAIIAGVVVWYIQNQPIDLDTITPTNISNSAQEIDTQDNSDDQAQASDNLFEQSDNLSPAGEPHEPEDNSLEPEGNSLEPLDNSSKQGDNSLNQQVANSPERIDSSPELEDSSPELEDNSPELEDNSPEPDAGSQETAMAGSQTQTAQSDTQAQAGQDLNAQQQTSQQIVKSHLELRFSDSCWINIEDATGERIAIGTKVKGHYTSVHGVAPFTIKLGKPDVVSIWLDGQAREIPYYPKGSIANFELAAN